MPVELPKGWARLSIEEAAVKCTSGYWGDEAPGNTTLECRVIRNGDVRKDTTVERDLPYRHFKPREVKRARVAVDDLILVTSGAYTGTVARIRESDVVHPTVASNFVRLIRGNGKTDGEFLGHLLASRVAQTGFLGFIGGSAIPNLQSAAYRLMKLPFPPLAEQRKIAAILSSIDDAIAATQKVIEQTKRVKQGLLQTLMTRGIGHTRFKKTQIGEIPEAWEVKELDALAEVAYGLTVNAARRRSEERVPLLTVAAHDPDDGWRADGVSEIGVLDGDRAKYTAEPGDILLVEGNGNPDLLGCPLIWDGRIAGALHQNHLIRVRPTSAESEWIALALFSAPVRQQIRMHAKSSSGLYTINSTVVKQTRLPLAPPQERQEIVAVLKCHDRAVAQNSALLASLKTLKRGVMQDLLTGRVRVQPD